MTLTHSDAALLIVGHGSTVNPDSGAPSLAHAAAIRRLGLFARVACVFWKEEPSLRDWPLLFDEPDAVRDVFVVPNFISEGYFTRTVIPRELDLDRLPDGTPAPTTVRADTGQRWHYCAPVGNHPSMTDLLLRRAREVAPGVPENETSLLIVGHGTGLNDNSAVAAKQQVELIRARGRYAEVINAYMEEPPLVADWAKLTVTPNVVVVPFFISDGLHSYQDIPVLLGIEAETTASASERLRAGEVFMQNPRHLHGRALYYASAIGTEAQFADVIVEQAKAAMTPDLAPRTSGQSTTGKQCFTWPAADRQWIGQILISNEAQEDGGFRHELRHREDDGRPPGELTIHQNPEDAAALALYDDAGAYRPLKTAPSLRHGWRLVLSDMEALLLALDLFYPGRLGAMRRFEEGRMVPTPLRDTLARQSGMYRVTGKITDEQADQLVGRFCRSDGGCLRTILWKRDAVGSVPSTLLPPEKFDLSWDQYAGAKGPQKAFGPLICQEACNLLVAEARAVVKGEKAKDEG